MKVFWKYLNLFMGFAQRHVPSANSMTALNHSALVAFEQLVGGLLAAFCLGLIGRYLPFWATPVGIACGAALGWQLGRKFIVASSTFLAVSTLYYFLAQPSIVLLLGVLIGVAASALTVTRLKVRLVMRLLAGFAVLLLAPALTIGIYLVLYIAVLPAAHPLTVWLYNLSPVLSMIPTLLLTGYCTLRQPDEKHSFYWMVTPVLATLFVVCFFPSHSYLAMATGVLTALALSIFAFVERPTSVYPQRGHRTFYATVAVAALFTGIYWVSNASQSLYDYQMANAVSVTEGDVADLDVTNNNRLVPRLAASDYCKGDNQESITTISSSPHPIVVDKSDGSGSEFYWECVRHPDTQTLSLRPGLIFSHPLAITGGAQGAVLANAGERGRYGKPIATNFVFGEDSVFTKGAFYARHPGATAQPGMIALTKEQDAYIVIPFVNKILQWGAMVPELSGVMTISPDGFIQDMLPSQAAAKFPGVAFMPSDLALQYADLWAHDSSFWATHFTGNQFEVSEIVNEGGNAYPYWEDFKNIGLKGVLNFEPIGLQQNSWVRIGLFDRASLSMKVIRVDALNLTGPKQLVLNAANASHPGLYSVTAREPLLVVSPKHCVYVMSALLQQTNPAYHGYSKNTVTDGHGQRYIDVDSKDDVDNAVADMDKTCVIASASTK